MLYFIDHKAPKDLIDLNDLKYLIDLKALTALPPLILHIPGTRHSVVPLLVI